MTGGGGGGALHSVILPTSDSSFVHLLKDLFEQFVVLLPTCFCPPWKLLTSPDVYSMIKGLLDY